MNIEGQSVESKQTRVEGAREKYIRDSEQRVVEIFDAKLSSIESAIMLNPSFSTER